MSEIFRKLDERAARERARADRVQRVVIVAIYFAAGLAMVWFGISDLKGLPSNHGGRLVGVPLVAASDFLMAASMLAMAALLLTRTSRENSKWYVMVLSAIFFSQTARHAAERDWRDVWFNGMAALFGLIVLGSVVQALVAARKRRTS